MNPFPYFPFYTTDWLQDERVSLMSSEAEGKYIRLLAYQWNEGSIPSDRSAIALLCKGDGSAIDEVLKCFMKAPGKRGRLINLRLEKERQKIEGLHNSKKNAGLAGANKRWHSHNSAISKRIAKDSYPDPDPDSYPDNKKKDKEIRRRAAKAQPSPLVGQVIEYLNQQAGKKFSPSSAPTVKHINARVAEGRTFDDFQMVIDLKVAKWKGDPKMDAYLRPETLFGSKMEGYVEEARLFEDQLDPAKRRALGEKRECEADRQKSILENLAKLEAIYEPKIQAARARGDTPAVGMLQEAADAEQHKFILGTLNDREIGGQP